MWVAFVMVGGCPWGTATAVPGLWAGGEFDKARPKTWQILATSSCEMPLNQQLWPATVVSATQMITVHVALAGLWYARSNYTEPGPRRAEDDKLTSTEYAHEHAQWTLPWRA